MPLQFHSLASLQRSASPYAPSTPVMNTDITKPSITSSWTVYDVLRYYPTTILVFNDLGIDSCCGGMATIEAAARDAAITPHDLIAALEAQLANDKEDEPASLTDRLLRRIR